MKGKGKIINVGIAMVLLLSLAMKFMPYVQGISLNKHLEPVIPGMGEDGVIEDTTRDDSVESGSIILSEQPDTLIQDMDTNDEISGVDIQSIKDSLTNNNRLHYMEAVNAPGPFMLDETGSFKVGVGYEEETNELDGEVEYKVSDRARLSLKVRQENEDERIGLSTQVGLSYDITANTSIAAGYRLLNFKDDLGSIENWESLAAAQFQLKF
jgi:hypothetical protein